MRIIDPDTENAVRRFISRLPADLRVEQIVLYGSRARGDYGPDSDADVALVVPHGADD
jgi:predicted nucleotidyltransferase